MFSAITQAKGEINYKAITFYKESVYHSQPFTLEDKTKHLLQESPSIKYFLKLFKQDDDGEIRQFFRRMVLTEYVKVNDLENAWKELAEFEKRGCPPKDLEDLQKYLKTHKQILQQISSENK